MTTSMGRLFDAVSALCGVRTAVNYEGQAAIELEARCDSPPPVPAQPPDLDASCTNSIEIAWGRGDGEDGGDGDGPLVLDPRPAIRAVVADIERGEPVGAVAGRFHAAVARATVDACRRLAAANDTGVVVLSGGVFQNRRLLEAVAAGLGAAGLRVLVPERLPVGDGGISYGQAAVAARRLSCR